MTVNNEDCIALGNRLLRENNYYDALSVYRRLKKDYANQASLLRQVEFNIELCEKLLVENRSKESERVATKTILAINPSHAHAKEIEFWSSFAQTARKNNFRFVDFAFRKFNKFEDSMHFVNPARLVDLYRKLSDLTEYDLPEWADENLICLYTDWEHRRWQLEKYDHRVFLGCHCLAVYMDRVFNQLKPAITLTSNKIDVPNQFAYLAAKYYNVEYRFIERSPLNSHLTELDGMFSESTFKEDVIESLLNDRQAPMIDDESSRKLLEEIVGKPYGFRESEAVKAIDVGFHNQKVPIFFLPLDNLLWTGWAQLDHPQGDLDYPVLRNPKVALRTLNEVISNELGGRLIVKPHPSCKEWEALSHSLPEIEFTKSDLNYLCDVADVIVTFLTKVSYLGLAKKKPVVSFCGGLLDGLGVTYQVRSEDKISETLKSALNKVDLNQKSSLFEKLLPHINNRFHEKGTDFVDILLLSLLKSHITYEDISDKGINDIFSRSHNKRKIPAAAYFKGFLRSEKAPIVIFDISRLLAKSLTHSGITRYVRSLADCLSKNKRINLILGYNAQKNSFGLSGYYFNQLRNDTGFNMMPLHIAFQLAEKSESKYIYHSPINPLPNAEEKKLKNIKNVLTVHDIFHLTNPEFYPNPSSYITPKVVESIDVSRDGIIFVSEFSRDRFYDYKKSKDFMNTVIHLSVADSFKCFSSKVKGSLRYLERFKIVVFPCQGDPRKGFSRMVSISKHWLEGGDASRKVLIFGSSKKRELYDQELSKLRSSISDSYLYLEDLNDSELAYVYSISRAHLFLSEAEGFGLPPLEAMSASCPSIMLSNTSLSEVYKEWPLLFPNNAKDSEIVESLNMLTDDSSYFYEISNEAYDFYRAKKDWRQASEATVDFYVECLKK